MSAKIIFVLCAQALLIQSVFSQCINRAIDGVGINGPGFGLANGIAAPGLAYNGLGASGLPFGPAMELTATSGGSLAVTSVSAIAPTGISIVSENVFEGPLAVAGELPFVGTTGMEGAMPSAGAGAINHACGNGVTAMISDASIAPGAAITPIAATFAPAASVAPAGATFGPAPAAGRFGLSGCGREVIY